MRIRITMQGRRKRNIFFCVALFSCFSLLLWMIRENNDDTLEQLLEEDKTGSPSPFFHNYIKPEDRVVPHQTTSGEKSEAVQGSTSTSPTSPDYDTKITSTPPAVTTSGPPLEVLKGSSLFMMDAHSAPAHEIRTSIGQFGVEMVLRQTSNCGWHPGELESECTGMKVFPLNNAFGMGLIGKGGGYSFQEIMRNRKEFFRVYSQEDNFLDSVDILACSFLAHICQMFMPFNKPILLLASHRFDTADWNKEEAFLWKDNVIRIAKNPRNVVAVSNTYDQQYLKHFTGVDGVLLEPSGSYICPRQYTGIRDEILVFPHHLRGYTKDLLVQLQQYQKLTIGQNRTTNSSDPLSAEAVNSYQFIPVHKLYLWQRDPLPYGECSNLAQRLNRYEPSWQDIAHHRAILVLPYAVHSFSLVEVYRLNIPLFVPSRQWLAQLHVDYQILPERTAQFGSFPPRGRNYQKTHGSLFPAWEGSTIKYDPNDDFSLEAVDYWLQFADFYIWPHIIYFDSFDDLFVKLATTNLQEVSDKMKKYNEEKMQEIHQQWGKVLHTLLQTSSNSSIPKTDFETTMKHLYGDDVILTEDPTEALKLLEEKYGNAPSPAPPLILP